MSLLAWPLGLTSLLHRLRWPQMYLPATIAVGAYTGSQIGLWAGMAWHLSWAWFIGIESLAIGLYFLLARWVDLPVQFNRNMAKGFPDEARRHGPSVRRAAGLLAVVISAIYAVAATGGMAWAGYHLVVEDEDWRVADAHFRNAQAKLPKDHGGAEQELRKALALMDSLARDCPHTPTHNDVAWARVAIAYEYLAWLQWNRGRLGEAEQSLRAALAIDEKLVSEHPDRPNDNYRQQIVRHRSQLDWIAYPYYNRGLAWQAKGDIDKALADYEESIRLDPKHANAYIARGNVWWAKGDHAKAQADYEESIRLDPKSANAYIGRGNAWQSKGDLAKAQADYEEAIRLDPKHANAYIGRGNVWWAKGDHAEAQAAFDEAIRLDPKSAGRGNAWKSKGDHAKAQADFEESIRLDPKKNAIVNYTRGRVWQAKGDIARAQAGYEEAFRLDPKHAGAFNSLAWILAACPDAKSRDGKRAVELATKACELSSWENAGIIDTLAAAHAEVGDFEAAVRRQEEAIGLATDDLKADYCSRLEPLPGEKGLSRSQTHAPPHETMKSPGSPRDRCPTSRSLTSRPRLLFGLLLSGWPGTIGGDGKTFGSISEGNASRQGSLGGLCHPREPR